MEQNKETSTIKRLYRSKVDRIIGGVCGGFAEYFDFDPTIVRVIWLIFLFLTGFGMGLLIYLVCLIVMKENPEQRAEDRKEQNTAIYWGIGLVLLGFMLLSNRWDWFYYYPFHFRLFRPWFFNWDRFWPLIIILFGIFYLIYVVRKKDEAGSNDATAESVPLTGRLFRTRDEKIIGGVCGGLAKNLNVDPVVVRIAYVILSLVTTVWLGIIVYIIWMIVIPEEPSEPASDPATPATPEPPAKKAPKRVKKLPDKDEPSDN